MTGSDGEFYSFTGGEIRTMETFSYGRYEFEVDFSGLKGVNESFFLAWDGGNYAKHHQFMGFQFMEKGFVTLYSIGPDEDSNGNHQPALNTKTNQPKAINKGTHTFAIEYTNSYVTWFYDDEPFRKERSNLPTEKMNIIFRTWLPSSEQYTVKTTKLPLETKYNYIRYYPTIEVGCYTVSDKPQEEEPQPVVEEPIISDNQETISKESTNCQDNSISELTNKIDSLPLGSVNLLGTTKAIKDMTPFKNSIVVWVYVNGVWKAYSSDSTVTSALESNGVELIYYIPAFSGYWIQK
jgi:beta-glucanase (GH16 family)